MQEDWRQKLEIREEMDSRFRGNGVGSAGLQIALADSSF
jgi:hypothetical protein